ncbi:MAG: response regulator, partial [Candidatus Aureabacteria bacterium]|nr:response regulator [Candidatus Auribacterota bacterium]
MNASKLILIVDDDPAALAEIEDLLSDLPGIRTASAATGEEAWRIVQNEPLAAALIDYRLPDINGLELLKRIKALSADIPVVIITGAGSIESGVEAIKEGAHDYLLKPFQPEKIRALVSHLADLSRLREENIALKEEVGIRYALNQPMGRSRAIQRLYDLLPGIAQTDSTVLIRGESGTGKELLARSIHAASPRRDMPFIIADCTALTESLLESELFGHEKGAFTG